MTNMARKRAAARKADSVKPVRISEMSDEEICKRANADRASGVLIYGETLATREEAKRAARYYNQRDQIYDE